MKEGKRERKGEVERAVDATKYRKLVLAGNRARNKQSQFKRRSLPRVAIVHLSGNITFFYSADPAFAASASLPSLSLSRFLFLCTQRNKSRQIKKTPRYDFRLSLSTRDLPFVAFLPFLPPSTLFFSSSFTHPYDVFPPVSPLSARLSLPLSRRPTSSRRCRMPRDG